jgi:excisionase family DNA binding protein
MTTVLEINGVSFLSIKEAARRASYSKDYVSRLAREEKIVATQVGRQWYVDPVSLKSFADIAKLEQEVRKQQLSVERRREQSIKRDVKTVRSSVVSKIKRRTARAGVAASFILFLGLSFGTASYIYAGSSVIIKDVKADGLIALMSVEDTAVSPVKSEDKVSLSVPKAEPVAVYSTVVDRTQLKNSSEVLPLTNSEMSGIFLLNEDSHHMDEEAVADIFSDDVEVRFTHETGGVVVYKTQSDEVREFPFVAVPEATKEASSSVVF